MSSKHTKSTPAGVPSKSQLKVLEAIYTATDCSNEVYDYATLHWTQERIAKGLGDLVLSIDGVVSVDGDGFVTDPERYGRGWRLTPKGYEALTAHDEAKWPAEAKYRRFGNEHKESSNA